MAQWPFAARGGESNSRSTAIGLSAGHNERRAIMCSVLIVEDTPIVREPLEKLLRYEGYVTTAASNGVEALEAMKRRTPDVILLDVAMPKMNGVEFLHQLRSDERWRDVPVILLTAVMDTTQLRLARELRVREVLFKSKFAFADLLGQIKLCLGVCEATG
jgi:CheY-like chemotaxis protein